MRCIHVKKLLSGYLDQELGVEEAAAVSAHLKRCATCRREAVEHEALHRLFASAHRFDAPYGFATRVSSLIKERERSGFRSIFSFYRLFIRVIEIGFAIFILTLGTISGNLLVSGNSAVAAKAGVREVFSLDLFEAAPPGSMGGVYVSMSGDGHEK